MAYIHQFKAKGSIFVWVRSLINKKVLYEWHWFFLELLNASNTFELEYGSRHNFWNLLGSLLSFQAFLQEIQTWLGYELILLKQIIPLEKSYFLDFYYGKASTKNFGSYVSLRLMLGGLWTCFLASTSSEKNILHNCCSDRSSNETP